MAGAVRGILFTARPRSRNALMLQLLQHCTSNFMSVTGIFGIPVTYNPHNAWRAIMIRDKSGFVVPLWGSQEEGALILRGIGVRLFRAKHKKPADTRGVARRASDALQC